MEELVTKMRVRKGLKVCIFFLDAVVVVAELFCSLKSRLLTPTTTSCNDIV